MVRIFIIGIVIAVAFTLYAIVDAAMTENTRARGVSKPVWVVLVVVLPVIGGILWFLIGKGAPRTAEPRRSAPDDDPRFTGTRLSSDDLDAHMRDLEDRLRELDTEVFPGEGGADNAENAPNASTAENTGNTDIVGDEAGGTGSADGTGSTDNAGEAGEAGPAKP